MRWHIIRTLLDKEIKRQLANRGGIALGILLIVAALLQSFFRRDSSTESLLAGGIEKCFVDYWRNDAWVQHLENNVPPELAAKIVFRDLDEMVAANQAPSYPATCAAIQLIPNWDTPRPRSTIVCFVHPDEAGTSLGPYESWFWRETADYMQAAGKAEGRPLFSIQPQRSRLAGGFDLRASITSSLVLFALFFSCVYLLPSMMCEERERGILLAQALSPASAAEILAAKFLFYPVVGILLAAILTAVSAPEVLQLHFFWLVLVVAAVGALGIGLTIACMCRSQRTASMGALCYMLVVAMFLWICQQEKIPGLPLLALEYHCPRMLHAAFSGTIQWFHWMSLLGAAVLAAAWTVTASVLFRLRGWQ